MVTEELGMGASKLRRLELGGGQVLAPGPGSWHLELPATAETYADAQIDDYSLAGSRRRYPWRPGTRMQLRARFSSTSDQLAGTAGFGFWNAPYGDPTVKTVALPQAVWFFFASPPSDLPFHTAEPGRGWFAATIDAQRPSAFAMAPLAPLVVALNQSQRLRRRIWPAVQRRLHIAAVPVAASLTQWHSYALEWLPTGCTFRVDDETVLRTPFSPRGPLGFVAWIDNQYLIASPRGLVGGGVVASAEAQSLDIEHLSIHQTDP